MLNITKTLDNGAAVFSLDGRLDTVTAPGFEKALIEAMPELSDLTLDLEKLEYVSSAGLRVLLSAQKQMSRQAGTMRLVHVCESVMEVLEITGFSEILTIE